MDLREPPATTEDPMTEDRMALVELWCAPRLTGQAAWLR